MTKLSLPVPSGFTITTKACIAYQKANPKAWPAGLKDQVKANVTMLEKRSGKVFGDPKFPLLVSVRSGAAQSMPGMMDTVLNLGLNEKIAEGLINLTKNERFVYDVYRRFITMFADVVMGVKREHFEERIDHIKKERGVKLDTELSAADLKKLTKEFLHIYEQQVRSPFPQDPQQQLELAIDAVFNSWGNSRAKTYRKLNKISEDGGTAVNIQEMVFGNMGTDSATGVAFTRNPSTGQNKRFGEYLANAQGEDVVAGIRTPNQLEDMKAEFPESYKQLFDVFELLEKNYRDMQDIEFTIEKNKLFILQTRNGKRTAAAAVKIAVDLVKEGMITKREALLRVAPEQLESLMHKAIDQKSKSKAKVVAKGLPASPGAAVGQIVFTAEAAVAAKERKEIGRAVQQECRDRSRMPSSA
eukprot:TRINITY_DN342_c0_g1_i4.p1 TRINITY_DN342_c0_g1~~TRINITY_DN342_c0_g1_i4.p1  ORF type:complete len:423 (-),score=79.51 TRINITY_DN342_c0_g1_i4:25-1266(-)